MSDRTSVAATTRALSLADAKKHLNVSTTYDDSYIGTLTDTATAYTKDRINQCLLTETRVLKMRGFYDKRYTHQLSEDRYAGESDERSVIFPPQGPLASVSSITYVDSQGTTQTLSSTVYSVSTGDSPGRIAEAYNNTWPDVRDQQDSVTVTYTCGYGTEPEDVPANIQHALKLLVGHWYRNREAVDVVQGISSLPLPMGVDALLAYEDMEQYG